MRPIGLHHVAVNVGDLEGALAFYCGVLGLTRRSDRPDLGLPGAWLEAGGQQVHLLEAPPPTARGQHFALAVGDLAASVAELRAAGVAVSDPSPVGRSLQSFVTDPWGNLVELHQVAT